MEEDSFVTSSDLVAAKVAVRVLRLGARCAELEKAARIAIYMARAALVLRKMESHEQGVR